MTDWLVTISSDGVVTQFKLGDDYDNEETRSKEKEIHSSAMKQRAKVIFVFIEGRKPQDDYRDKELLKRHLQKIRNEFYSSKGAWGQGEMWGYKMRQNTIKGQPYIEVVSRLDADDLNEFSQLDPKDILMSAVKLMYPIKNDPGKTIVKWIQRLEDEEDF